MIVRDELILREREWPRMAVSRKKSPRAAALDEPAIDSLVNEGLTSLH